MKRFGKDSRPAIDYPVSWKYTVIGIDRTLLEVAVSSVIGERSHQIKLSNVSKSGRYTSLRLELIVLNEAERLDIFHQLNQHPAITFVL